MRLTELDESMIKLARDLKKMMGVAFYDRGTRYIYVEEPEES